MPDGLYWPKPLSAQEDDFPTVFIVVASAHSLQMFKQPQKSYPSFCRQLPWLFSIPLIHIFVVPIIQKLGLS